MCFALSVLIYIVQFTILFNKLNLKIFDRAVTLILGGLKPVDLWRLFCWLCINGKISSYVGECHIVSIFTEILAPATVSPVVLFIIFPVIFCVLVWEKLCKPINRKDRSIHNSLNALIILFFHCGQLVVD